MFRPSMVLNQRQVFVIVSDWEPYLGSLGFTVCLWVIVSVSVHHTVLVSVIYVTFIVFLF